MVKYRRHISYSKQNANTQEAIEASSAALFALKQAFLFTSLLSLLTIDNQLEITADH